MSILIKGVSLPSSCWLCAYEGILPCPCSTEPASDYKDKRHPDCPLAEVPEPHGRLIDGDKLEDVLSGLGDRAYRRTKGTIMDAQKFLSYAPTVIEAEEPEHE